MLSLICMYMSLSALYIIIINEILCYEIKFELRFSSTTTILITNSTFRLRVSTVIQHKSAIADHADRNNCNIDWEEAKVIDRDKNARWIRKITPVMNRDEGGAD